MKNTLIILFSLITLSSCTRDNFSETERHFLTDKSIYQTTDTFELTVVITPLKEKKIVRFFDSFYNLRIYFSLINKQKGIDSEDEIKLKDKFLENSKIIEYEISKNRPFKKTFHGKIYESLDEVMLEIPELHLKERFSKSDFDEFSKIKIQGYCEPINPETEAVEEFITAKEIKILIK